MRPNLAYIEGRDARKEGNGRDACQYAPNTAEYLYWMFGWEGADGFAKGEEWHAEGRPIEEYDGVWFSLHHAGFLAGWQQAEKANQASLAD